MGHVRTGPFARNRAAIPRRPDWHAAFRARASLFVETPLGRRGAGPGYITHMNPVDAGIGLSVAGRPRCRTFAGAVIVLAVSAACQESLTQVDSGVVAPALRPALKIAQPLPGLPDITAAGRPAGQEAPLAARWTRSWNRGVAAGRSLREAIYVAAGPLALEVDSATAGSAAKAVRGALDEARSFGRTLPPRLSRALGEAERLLGEAEQAGLRADWGGAAVKALMAADALRETSPRAVALSLVEAAEAVLGLPPGQEDDREPVDRARARRLAWWARLAIGTGGYEVALQRGYYACLLLGLELP